MQLQLPDFKKARVMVVGDLMLDRYWHGNTSRISPEAPVPVVKVGDEEQRPGGAGNVALNISRLGAKVSLIGLTGDDHNAIALQRQLEDEGVDCNFLPIAGKSTITKLRIISRHQQLIRLDFEDGFEGYDLQALQSLFSEQLAEADVVVLSDYGKGTLSQAAWFIQQVKAAGKQVLVDPKGSDFTRYKGSTLITPNLTEFEHIVGECSNDEELVKKAEDLVALFDLTALLVTRSERGMTLVQQSQEVFHLPTQAREVFDVTGAGDTVIAVLAASLAAGQTLQQATALSNLAAGIVVGKLGTATASKSELQLAIAEEDRVQSSIVDQEQLLEIMRALQDKGETIVMTNGCFDILHAGHVSYLRQARQAGHRLIVAVNDDESVKRLKGESRPVNNLAQRMEVLAALESVDWVIPFSEDTPENLICSLLPDVLVKGGDYKVDEIAGADCVTSAGGKVVVQDFVDGCSTSRIIDMIRNPD